MKQYPAYLIPWIKKEFMNGDYTMSAICPFCKKPTSSYYRKYKWQTSLMDHEKCEHFVPNYKDRRYATGSRYAIFSELLKGEIVPRFNKRT